MIPGSVGNQKLKMLVVILLGWCMLIAQNALANTVNPPLFNWVKEIGTNSFFITKMIPAEEGSVISIGDISANKIDSTGNIVWEKQLSNTRSSGFALKDVCLAKDGGYVFLAIYSGSANDESYLIKLDRDGNRLWEKSLADNKDQQNVVKVTNVIQTNDGGFILAGPAKTERGVYLLKTNAQGDPQWSSVYSKDKDLEITGLLQTSDGGYTIIGNSLTEFKKPAGAGSFWVGNYRDGFILKVAQTGHKEWESVLSGTHHNSANIVQETSDRGLIIGGGYALTDDKNQAYLLKLNPDKTTKWEKIFSSPENVWVTFLKLTSDGGYLALAGPDIIKVDQNGNQEWERTTFGRNMSIMETSDGYLARGVKSEPPGIYYFTAHNLSYDTQTILQRNYSQLSSEAKIGFALNLWELQISRLQQYVEKFKKSSMTAKDKAKIDQELSAFEKTADQMQKDMELAGTFGTLVEYLYKSAHPLVPKYLDLKRQYNLMAEIQVDKHIYLPDELQKRYGDKKKISRQNMDGLIVSKDNSFYTLDIRKVKKYTVTENRIEIITKNKTYFLRTDVARMFPTYAGRGVALGNFKYVFSTTGYKKPVANDWILINDVIKYLMDQPKKKSLRYKDLVITKEKGQVYNIKISRTYNGPNHQYFMPGGEWQANSNYFAITTKGPAVTYFISMADSGGTSYINEPKAVLKFKDCTYKVTVVK